MATKPRTNGHRVQPSQHPTGNGRGGRGVVDLPRVSPVRNEDALNSGGLARRMAWARRALDNDGEQYDINTECGYPAQIDITQYQEMFDREGVATRVVGVLPEESWAMDPEVYEIEDADRFTPFEIAWNDIVARHNIWHYMHRADELSGVGHYGIILIGIDDGKKLEEPVDGVEAAITARDAVGRPAPAFNAQPTANLAPAGPNGKRGRLKARNPNGTPAGGDGAATGGTFTPTHKITYLRVFSEANATIEQWEDEPTNPRYGQPVMYKLTLRSLNTSTTQPGGDNQVNVHWTRVVHIADNCKSSEVLGTPRMQTVFNRLIDIRKIMGGSAEMFWKGGFPGYAFSLMPEVTAAGVELSEEDREKLRGEIDLYYAGLKRYLALVGMNAQTLAPQVADPSAHFEGELRFICLTIGVPWRVFIGSEEAKLAATQDTRTWNKRLAKRQEKYIGPKIIRPFVERLMFMGIMPPPAEVPAGRATADFTVWWPDLNTITDEDRADSALKRTQALSTYVGGGVDTLVPPLEYFTEFLGIEKAMAEVIIQAAAEQIAAIAAEEEVVGRTPKTETEKVNEKLEQEKTKKETTQIGKPKPAAPKPKLAGVGTARKRK